MSSKLSYVPLLGGYIDWIWPTPCREPLQSSQDGLGGSMDYLARSMSAGLLLPFAAYLVGFCFRSVTKSNTKRIILVCCEVHLCCATLYVRLKLQCNASLAGLVWRRNSAGLIFCQF